MHVQKARPESPCHVKCEIWRRASSDAAAYGASFHYTSSPAATKIIQDPVNLAQRPPHPLGYTAPCGTPPPPPPPPPPPAAPCLFTLPCQSSMSVYDWWNSCEQSGQATIWQLTCTCGIATMGFLNVEQKNRGRRKKAGFFLFFFFTS